MARIYHRVAIDADPELVYECITTQEGLASWWTKDCDAKAEVGFVNEFRFEGEIYNKMKVVHLEPNKQVRWECVDSAEEWLATRIFFDIERIGDLTFLSFQHAEWRDETEFFATCSFHWAKYLLSLKMLCETGMGAPFDSGTDMKEVNAIKDQQS